LYLPKSLMRRLREIFYSEFFIRFVPKNAETAVQRKKTAPPDDVNNPFTRREELNFYIVL
jgi:hypothetical protein